MTSSSMTQYDDCYQGSILELHKMWESIQRNAQIGIERRLEGHSLQASYGRLIELYWNSV